MTKHTHIHRRLVLNCCLIAVASFACAGGVKGRAEAAAPVAPAADVVAIPDVRHVTTANTGFAFRLLRRLMQDQPAGNVFLSPFSVSEALTMTLNGAGTQTRTDMARTLGLGPSDMERVNHASGLLLASLADPAQDVQVSVANALWADKRVTLVPDFAAVCLQDYNAQATTLDMADPAAVETINGWAGRATQGKITRLVTRDDIAGATAVLTNAVYFHGRWQTPFNKAVTQAAPFHLDGTHTRDVPMMRQAGSLSYLETPKFQIVAIPYGGGRMSLFVLLPQNGSTPESLSDGYTAFHWETTVAAMKPASLLLSLPRFQARSGTRLRKPLSALGMASAFRGGADFGPMGLHDSSLSDVIHDAVIDVNEEGTEAAAATGALTDRGISVTPVSMRVDRPFLIAVRDNATGTLLFVGVIRDPK